jgi:hypothetical protein
MPPYIAAAAIDDSVLRFVWDDTRGTENVRNVYDELVSQVAPLTLRAKIALGIGIYQWIIWRFEPMLTDPLAFQLEEAAWCANVDRHYMEYFELDRQNWLGPVRGPLWCAITWLMPMIYFSDERPEEWRSGLSFLPNLALHVLTRKAPFESWLNACVERLLSLHAEHESDPFEDLFGELQEERRGALIAPEAVNPEFDYHPEQVPVLLGRYLQSVAQRQNPLLRSPDEMRRAGFVGTPYAL